MENSHKWLDGEILEEAVIAQAMAERLGFKYTNLTGYRPDTDVFDSLPEGILGLYDFIPLGDSPLGFAIAISDPTDIETLSEIESLIGKPLDVFVTTKSAITNLITSLDFYQYTLRIPLI